MPYNDEFILALLLGGGGSFHLGRVDGQYFMYPAFAIPFQQSVDVGMMSSLLIAELELLVIDFSDDDTEHYNLSQK